MKKLIQGKYIKTAFMIVGVCIAVAVVLLAIRSARSKIGSDLPRQFLAEVLLTTDVVAQHNTKDSCYTIINDKVYDLTTWVDSHPGGTRAIESLCGRDSTPNFKNKHNLQVKPQEALDKLYIGPFKP